MMLIQTSIGREKSLRTRRQINDVIDRLELDRTVLETYGMIDRIIRGYLKCERSAKKPYLKWVPDLPMIAKEYPVTVYVPSEDGDIDYIVKVGLQEAEIKTKEEKDVHYLEIIRATDHSCEDELYQHGLKKIPTVCKHRVASIYTVQEKLPVAFEEGGIDNWKVLPFYEPIEPELIDLYDLLFADRTYKAAQRMEILYRFAMSDSKVFFIDNGHVTLDRPSKNL